MRLSAILLLVLVAIVVWSIVRMGRRAREGRERDDAARRDGRGERGES